MDKKIRWLSIKMKRYAMFEKLIDTIDDEIVHRIYKIQVQEPPEVHATHSHIATQAAGSETSQASKPTPVVNNKKLGRNDPCPCGSGKKWKKCHYPEIP